MILHLLQDTPLVIRAPGGNGARDPHRRGAALGIVSGFVALLATKGRRLHTASPATVFFGAMLAMSAVAAVVGAHDPRPVSALMGAVHLLPDGHGLGAVRRRPAGSAGRAEVAARRLLPLGSPPRPPRSAGSWDPRRLDHLLEGQPLPRSPMSGFGARRPRRRCSTSGSRLAGSAASSGPTAHRPSPVAHVRGPVHSRRLGRRPAQKVAQFLPHSDPSRSAPTMIPALWGCLALDGLLADLGHSRSQAAGSSAHPPSSYRNLKRSAEPCANCRA